MRLSIVVPCYNESDNVAKLQEELLPVVEELIFQKQNNDGSEFHSAEFIFVDDGSRDETYSRLKRAFETYSRSRITFKFLRHDINLGLGAAIRTGFSNAEGDIILTVDSDGTYMFSEIPALLSALRPEIDIVTASPYHPAGAVVGIPAFRLILSKGSSLLYRILVDWNVHTYTCLFRAYRLEVIRDVPFRSDGFLAGTELLVKAILKGYRVAEFPAVLYRRMYGVSKARLARTIFSHLSYLEQVLLYRVQLMIGLKPK